MKKEKIIQELFLKKKELMNYRIHKVLKKEHGSSLTKIKKRKTKKECKNLLILLYNIKKGKINEKNKSK